MDATGRLASRKFLDSQGGERMVKCPKTHRRCNLYTTFSYRVYHKALLSANFSTQGASVIRKSQAGQHLNGIRGLSSGPLWVGPTSFCKNKLPFRKDMADRNSRNDDEEDLGVVGLQQGLPVSEGDANGAGETDHSRSANANRLQVPVLRMSGGCFN
jgi:hypothetical protein